MSSLQILTDPQPKSTDVLLAQLTLNLTLDEVAPYIVTTHGVLTASCDCMHQSVLTHLHFNCIHCTEEKSRNRRCLQFHHCTWKFSGGLLSFTGINNSCIYFGSQMDIW